VYKARSTASSLTLSGLVNGATYSLALVANSSPGASIAATSTGTPSANVAPSAPQGFQVLPNGKEDLDVTWSAPSDLGTAPLLGYHLTWQKEVNGSTGWIPSGASHSRNVSATASKIALAGLVGFYTITLAAHSKAGNGPTVLTADPVTPSVVLSPKTVILSESTLESLQSFVGGELTWTNPAPAQVKKLKAGDILIGTTSATTPDGLLASVVSVSAGVGVTTVVTGVASLSEAFRDLSFSTSSDPLAAENSKFEPFVAGIRPLAVAPNVSVTLSHTFGFNLGGGGVDVSGSTSLTGNLNLSASITKNFIGIPNGVSMTASATVTASVSVQASISASRGWKLGQITGSPILLDIAGIPFTLVPTIPVFLNVSGSITVGASASLTVGASVTWTSKNPRTLSVQNLSRAPGIGGGPLAGVAATASASISLEVQPQLEVDGIGGPNLQVTASLAANVNFLSNPYFTLTPSVAIAVGLDINFLYIHASLEVTLKTLTWSPYKIASPPSATLTVNPQNSSVSPGGQLQMSATRSDGRSFSVTWELQGGTSSDSITSGGVLNVGFPAGTTFEVIASDSTGAVGKTTVTVTTPGSPSAPNNVQAVNVGQTTATISWSAPSSDGGSDITGYAVTGAGSGCSTDGGGTSCGISGLSADTTYTVYVQASNIEGGGAQASVTFTTAPNQTPPTLYGPFTTGCTGSGCLHGIYSEPSWQGSYLGPVYSPVYIYCYVPGTNYKGDDEYDLLNTGGYITDYYVILSGQESASQYGIPSCPS
jgi:hypothetical protein